MEYNPYDSDPNREYRFDGSFSDKKKRKGSDVGCFLLVFFSVILIAALVGLLVEFVHRSMPPMPWVTPLPNTTMLPDTPNGSTGTRIPVTTPSGTERPLPTYDGSLPTINDTGNPFPDIIDGVKNGVVSVCNYMHESSAWGANSETLQGSGTGFVISSQGYILTNAHVIENADVVKIQVTNGTEYAVEVIGYDLTCDVAVLKFDNTESKLPALSLGNSENVRVGEFVITVGDPSGLELAGSTTFGIVSATARNVNINGRSNEYIQTDAAMNPGNSGGPLINTHGEVIGINSAKTVTASYDENGSAINAEGLGFAIPINTAVKIAEQLISKGYIQRPGIGLSVTLASAEVLHEAGLKNGLVVYSVIEGGPAAKAGLQKDDIVLSCNGVTLTTVDDFVTIIQKCNVGDSITATYIRDGKEAETVISVGDLNLIS